AALHLPLENLPLDPEVLAALHRHIQAPRSLAEQEPARRVIETGGAFGQQMDFVQMRRDTSPPIVRGYETIGLHTPLMVALRAQGRSTGLLALVRFLPGSQPFDERDRDLAQMLADHAALAIANARLYQEARDAVRARELFLSLAS